MVKKLKLNLKFRIEVEKGKKLMTWAFIKAPCFISDNATSSSPKRIQQCRGVDNPIPLAPWCTGFMSQPLNLNLTLFIK